MSYEDIITAAQNASDHAQEAATHAQHTKRNFPGANAQHKEELSLAVSNLALAVQQLAQELRNKDVI